MQTVYIETTIPSYVAMFPSSALRKPHPRIAMKNEILEEVRAARAALAAEHGYDRQRIFEWARATTAAHQQARREASVNSAPETSGGVAKLPEVRKRGVRPAKA